MFSALQLQFSFILPISDDNPINLNAASTRGFVVKAKLQRKSRRCA